MPLSTLVREFIRRVLAAIEAIAVAIVGPIEVVQATHDNLNANANLQIEDADVTPTNPLPTTFGEILVNFFSHNIAMVSSINFGDSYRLCYVMLHFDVAPVTAEDFRIFLNSKDGAPYDTTIYAVDPSAGGGITDIIFYPDGDLIFVDGDQLEFTYTNTDGRTWGRRAVLVRV